MPGRLIVWRPTRESAHVCVREGELYGGLARGLTGGWDDGARARLADVVRGGVCALGVCVACAVLGVLGCACAWAQVTERSGSSCMDRIYMRRMVASNMVGTIYGHCWAVQSVLQLIVIVEIGVARGRKGASV